MIFTILSQITKNVKNFQFLLCVRTKNGSGKMRVAKEYKIDII